MTDRPILFSAPMIRALLDGRKTQTRRLATSTPMQRVQPGDRLWVREAWACHWATDDQKPSEIDPILWSVRYFADNHIRAAADTRSPQGSLARLDQCKKQRPGMFMPRWASRLTLTMSKTVTQPLQSITEADARAEGIERVQMYPGSSHYQDHEARTFAFPQFACASLWNSLHPKPGERWEDNPDVIALTFKVEQRNVDG